LNEKFRQSRGGGLEAQNVSEKHEYRWRGIMMQRNKVCLASFYRIEVLGTITKLDLELEDKTSKKG
jgi:hypothetical protein